MANLKITEPLENDMANKTCEGEETSLFQESKVYVIVRDYSEWNEYGNYYYDKGNPEAVSKESSSLEKVITDIREEVSTIEGHHLKFAIISGLEKMITDEIFSIIKKYRCDLSTIPASTELEDTDYLYRESMIYEDDYVAIVWRHEVGGNYYRFNKIIKGSELRDFIVLLCKVIDAADPRPHLYDTAGTLQDRLCSASEDLLTMDLFNSKQITPEWPDELQAYKGLAMFKAEDIKWVLQHLLIRTTWETQSISCDALEAVEDLLTKEDPKYKDICNVITDIRDSFLDLVISNTEY